MQTKRRTPSDPILTDVRRRLGEMYGDRIKRVVLYGSRARGDHRRNSDYDIAVFLRGRTSPWREIGPLSDLGLDLWFETKKDVSIKPFRMVDWRIDTLFMRHLKRDGIEL